MNDLTPLILRHNPPDIPCTETSFYSWLMTSDDTDRRIDCIVEYLDGMYDFDIHDFYIQEYGLQVLRALYSIFWMNEVEPTL